MKRVILFLALAVGFVSACNVPNEKPKNADALMQAQTEQSMQEATRQIGMPAITNFQEKKLMKQIYELRDREDLICFAYIVDMHGKMHFIGKCLGYGIPYSTQFSNPLKFGTVKAGGQYGGENPYTMPQSEPNGLFMPEGLSATWLLMIDPETNEARPVYLEPEILVSPFKLH